MFGHQEWPRWKSPYRKQLRPGRRAASRFGRRRTNCSRVWQRQGSMAKTLPDGWRMVRFGDVVREATEHEREPLAKGLQRYVGLDDLDPGSLKIQKWGLIEEGTSFTK